MNPKSNRQNEDERENASDKTDLAILRELRQDSRKTLQ